MTNVSQNCARLFRYGIAASALMAIAACGGGGDGTTADTDAADQQPEQTGQVIARVNGTEITMHQLNGELARMKSVNDDNRQRVSEVLVKSLVVRSIFEQRAKEMNMDRNPRVMLDVQRAESAALARAYISARASGAPQPTRQEADAFIAENPEYFGSRTYYIFDSITAPTVYMTDERRDAWEEYTDLTEIEIELRRQNVIHERKPYTVYSEGLPKEILADMENIRIAGDVFYIINGANTHITLFSDSRPASLTGEAAVRVATNYLRKLKSEEFLKKIEKEAIESSSIEYVGEFANMGQAASPAVEAVTTDEAESDPISSDGDET